ncbi:hypothetical protein [Halopenitus persicus]|uniref:Uncharacterized protein n=1 Tax=Halopenitus persicus TaxID=1048396 RepID=A0A1H3HRV6_9EURY|nr:hypothetical protein [Halopenitus persicus]QHS15887.1 hypothetical protein GWK26_01275 [haloarchaeon 3A1-DGR]SDY17538.1 hypothetical protein SAMN05216564_103382 [Halopenitus persicus]
MRPPHAVLVGSAVLLLLVGLVPAGSAAPPPEGVCGICGAEFERAAAADGVNATVGGSSLTVRVAADGTSRWRATATLNRAAANRFAENRTLLRRVVDRSYASSRTVVDEPENRSVALADRTVTVTFAVSDAAERYPGDVLLFTEFTRQPPHGAAYVNADRLTVAGPANTTVTHAPPGSTIDGNRVVRTVDGDRGSDGPRLGREATVAFAPADGPLAQAATAAAVRLNAFGMIESELRQYALGPAVLLGLVATGLLLGRGRLPPALARGRTVTRWLAAGVGLYAALVAIAALVAGDDLWLVLGLVGVGLAPQTFVTATAAILLAPVPVDVDPDGNVTGLAAVSVLAWTLVLVLGAPASALLVLGVGPLVFLPFGVLAGAGRRSRVLFPAVAALGPIVAALPFVPQVGVVFVSPTMLALLSGGTALLGVPLFAIGHRLGNAIGGGGATSERSSRSDGSASG